MMVIISQLWLILEYNVHIADQSWAGMMVLIASVPREQSLCQLRTYIVVWRRLIQLNAVTDSYTSETFTFFGMCVARETASGTCMQEEAYP